MIDNFILVAAETSEATSHSTTIGNILFVAISFLILMACLKKFAWSAIAKMLDERANKIANDLDEAEASKENAKVLAAQCEEELTTTRLERKSILNEAKDLADKNKDQIIATAQEDATKIKEQAKKNMAAEREQIFVNAKDEIAEMSIEIAAKIIGKELNETTHTELINSYIEGLGDSHEVR